MTMNKEERKVVLWYSAIVLSVTAVMIISISLITLINGFFKTPAILWNAKFATFAVFSVWLFYNLAKVAIRVLRYSTEKFSKAREEMRKYLPQDQSHTACPLCWIKNQIKGNCQNCHGTGKRDTK